MPKKPGDKGKVTGVKGAGMPEGIERTSAISEVEKAKKTAPVAGVRGLGALGKTRATRIMSSEEREAIFNQIQEEADKLFSKSGMSSKQRQVVETAVKMAVDAAIVDDDQDPKNSKGKDKHGKTRD